MASYRLYGFANAQHIQDVAELLGCTSDEDALAAAHELLKRFARVEVWDLSRKIATLQRAATRPSSRLS